jgi:hypothetical protein
MNCKSNKNALLFIFGVITGAAALVYATDALPRMMSVMMKNMMARMKEEGCNPEEF